MDEGANKETTCAQVVCALIELGRSMEQHRERMAGLISPKRRKESSR